MQFELHAMYYNKSLINNYYLTIFIYKIDILRLCKKRHLKFSTDIIHFFNIFTQQVN